ncbi:general transcription factor 3C polypeptide 3 (transcription factor C subunit 4), partial [Phenoliferia sp. Uapishka_3]
MDDELFPDLVGFSRTQTGSFDFALDPSLGGPVASTSRGGFADGDDGESYDEDESDSDDGSVQDDALDDDETDAEDEFRAQEEGGVKRKKGKGGTLEALEKGKEREREVYTGVEGDEGEEIGRLIHAIRESGTTSVGGRTALDKEFDRSIEEEMEDLDGFSKKKGKGGKKGMGRRPMAELEPSTEVSMMLGIANEHYVMGRNDEALEVLTEVVRIDPTIKRSWFILSTIWEDKGDKEKSIMFRIVANHLGSEKQNASDWASLGTQSRDIGLLQQAIYCFTQAIKGDKGDVDSMWDRAMLLQMSGSTKQATTAFTALLSHHPHDPGVLRELSSLLALQQQHAKACALYLSSFEYFRTTVPHVDPESEASLSQISYFGFEDLETIADLLTVQKQWAKVVTVIKEGVRWLQGREKETGWDASGDDREYDVTRKSRTGWEKAVRFLEDAPIYELDVRLRVRLAVARLGEGRVDEAQRHFAIFLQENVAEFPELFGAVADAYYEAKMFSEALDVYQEMAENDETNGPLVWMKVAQCNHQLGDLDQARECYEAVAQEEPGNLFSKMQLAKVYEQMGEPARALDTINEIIEARRQNPEASEDYERPPEANPHLESANHSSARKGRVPLTKEDRIARDENRRMTEEQRYQEFSLAFSKLSLLDPRVSKGDEQATIEWLEVATHLVDAFRETRQLFPSDGKRKFAGVLTRGWRRKGAGEVGIEAQADEMASRLERTMHAETEEAPDIQIDSFRGKDFDGWMALIIKYAFLLAKNDEVEAGIETLLHVQEANIFKHSEQRTLTLRLARVACCLHAGRHDEAVTILRWVWLRYHIQTHPLRLIQSLLSQGIGSIQAFNSSNFQKYIFRQLHHVDDLVAGREINDSKKGPRRDRRESTENHEDDVEEEEDMPAPTTMAKFKPTVTNPIFILTYGTMLLLSRSFQSAIIYLLRAHELAPSQPLIIFCLGVGYLHRAMVRQTDNRNHQIAQALGWFSQYRKLRGETQEVEYNFGRVFQHLGLQSYAVKHYEKVLKLATADRLAARASRMELDRDNDDSDDEDEGPDDFARVAAYNLSILYVTTGSDDLARSVAKRWLAV